MNILPTSVQNLITENSLVLIEDVSFCYIVFRINTSHVALAESKCTDLCAMS
jgi:hypothetical protein